jgi:cytochrome P450
MPPRLHEPIDAAEFASLGSDPLAVFLALQRKWGDIVPIRDEQATWYLLSHPDQVKHVLKDNAAGYRRSHALVPLLGAGLLAGDGPVWAKQRSLVQPELQRLRISARFPHIVAATAGMLERWSAGCGGATQINLTSEMVRLTVEIAGQTLFGVDLTADSTVIAEAVTAAADRIFFNQRRTDVAPRQGSTPAASLPDVRDIVHDISLRHGSAGAGQDDLLAKLWSYQSTADLSEQEVHDLVLTLLFAGYETCSKVLPWTWYLLAGAPAIERRFRHEVDTVLDGRPPLFDDLLELQLTARIAAESLRLFPPVWCFGRQAVVDDDLGGYRIPADGLVMVSPFVTHRHADFWSDPETFDPDRFLPERSVGRHRFAYFPFGAGHQQCIGAQLATMEVQAILAMVAQRYRLQLSNIYPVEPAAASTLTSHHGIWVTLHEAPSRRR